MPTQIRHAHPSDYGRVIQHVNAWWGGRDMAPMLPKLFFLHFEGTSFVAETDDGALAAFSGNTLVWIVQIPAAAAAAVSASISAVPTPRPRAAEAT